MEKTAVFPGGYGRIGEIPHGRLWPDWGLKGLKPTELCDGNHLRNKSVQSWSNPSSKVITCIWCSHCAMILSLEMDILD